MKKFLALLLTASLVFAQPSTKSITINSTTGAVVGTPSAATIASANSWGGGGGSGNVTGPGSSVSNNIVTWNGTAGTSIKDSGANINSGTMTGVNTITANATTNFTVSGGSTGSNITLGQGSNGNVTVTPKGTGILNVSANPMSRPSFHTSANWQIINYDGGANDDVFAVGYNLNATGGTLVGGEGVSWWGHESNYVYSGVPVMEQYMRFTSLDGLTNTEPFYTQMIRSTGKLGKTFLRGAEIHFDDSDGNRIADITVKNQSFLGFLDAGGNVNSISATPSSSTGLHFGYNYSGGNAEGNLVLGTGISPTQYILFSAWDGATMTEMGRFTGTGNFSAKGVIIAGTTPTTLTDSAGKILSAALNTVGVAQGGTGATTLTANNIITGNGTGAVTFLAPGTSGNIVTSNGTAWTSAAPATNGTVTSVSVTTANGVSGSVATATTTPAITLTLGAITPSSVASSGAVSGTSFTDSGLTATRVPFAGTGGLLSDASTLTFNSGTGALSATSFVGSGASLTGVGNVTNSGTLASGNIVIGGGTTVVSTTNITVSGNDTTFPGTVTMNNATTPAISLASGKTNTGNITISGKTSGSVKYTTADATAQAVTYTTAAQTSGAATITLTDRAGTNGNIVIANATLASGNLTVGDGGAGVSTITTDATAKTALGVTPIGAGNIILDQIAFNTQTANYTLVAADEGKWIVMNNSTANNTLTIPKNATVAFPVGTQIALEQRGTFQVTVSAVDANVTINARGTATKMVGQYSTALLTLITVSGAATTWNFSGDITP